MLTIKIPICPEGWDDEKQEFVEPKYEVITLEHSLLSVAKWESKWKKSFLYSNNKTSEEIVDYIKCMTLTKNVPDAVYNYLTSENVTDIKNYIEDPMTATVFAPEDSGGSSRKVITAEVIYGWMVTLQINWECQKWHLNRLLTLIRVLEIENRPKKKMPKSSVASQYSKLNAARRSKYGTKG